MLGFVKNAVTEVTKLAGRTGLHIQKASPEILVGAGIAGVCVGAVLACKATLKVDEIVDEAATDINKIKEAKNDIPNEDYSETDYRKDIAKAYCKAGGKFVRLYGPSVAIGTVSIFSILYGHNILRKRNLAMAAAYKALDESFARYRRRVADELGDDVERNIKRGIIKTKAEIIETDEKGNEVKKEEVVSVTDPNMISEYARFFDESSRNWNKSPEYNLLFLRSQQNYANNLLKARGHVFLNEVYDMLDIPRTSAGAVVGWVLGAGDDYVDFGIYDIDKDGRNFVNGTENVILLDFNVDGLIYDKI